MLVLKYCPACQINKLGCQDMLIQMSLCKSINVNRVSDFEEVS